MQSKNRKRIKLSSFFILFLIPLTILFGVVVLEDRKYYFISLLILIYTMIPFAMIFEKREPMARELVLIAVLSALGVVGRSAFFMIAQFKPVVAIVIISGVSLGPESGFLVGAMTGFVSNFLFGQGPWTPWQMFGFGIIGFLAGVLYYKNILKKNRLSLCIYGGLSTFIIYGLILDFASVLMFTGTLTMRTLKASLISGIPFNFVHAVSTIVFLFILSQPMLKKIDRIKIKYGLIDT